MYNTRTCIRKKEARNVDAPRHIGGDLGAGEHQVAARRVGRVRQRDAHELRADDVRESLSRPAPGGKHVRVHAAHVVLLHATIEAIREARGCKVLSSFAKVPCSTPQGTLWIEHILE